MTKIYGPYIRKDGRKHVIVIESGIRKTISYPKYIIQKHLGRNLEKDETVDHINGDFTDDRLENLQVISRSENSSKYFIDHPELKTKYLDLICSFCGKNFQRSFRRYKEQIKKNKNKDYFFCSRSCQGKVFN